MKSRLFSRGRLAVLACAALAACLPALAWEPSKTVEFVVPAGTGGGADQMARFIQSVIAKHNLMKEPMVVVNQGGGAGAEGFLDGEGRQGRRAQAHHHPLEPLHHAARHGRAVLWKDLTPVEMMALDEFVLWVNAETPYKTSNDYIAAMKAAGPGKFKMGGTGSKQEDQIVTVNIEKQAGVKFTYIPYKGGGEVATQLVGKHVDSTREQPDRGRGSMARGQPAPAVRVRLASHALQGRRSRRTCPGATSRPASRRA